MRLSGSVPELTFLQETHTVDQHLNFLSGTAEAIIDGGAKVWRMDYSPRWTDRQLTVPRRTRLSTQATSSSFLLGLCTT